MVLHPSPLMANRCSSSADARRSRRIPRCLAQAVYMSARMVGRPRSERIVTPLLLVSLVRVSNASRTQEDVRRGTLGEPEQGPIEHVESAGDNFVQLSAPIIAGVSAEPVAQPLCSLECCLEAIQVFDLGECPEARIVVPEVRPTHRLEPRSLAPLDAVRLHRRADPLKLVEKEPSMRRIALGASASERRSSSLSMVVSASRGGSSRALGIGIDECDLDPVPSRRADEQELVSGRRGAPR